MTEQINQLQQSSESDELIYFAKYSFIKLLFSWLVNSLGIYLIIGVNIEILRAGEYFNGVLRTFLSLAILIIFVDSILFRGLYFYKDRVVKMWKFGGKKTIYYNNAKVYGPPIIFKWLTSSYTIRATKKDGRVLILQFPIQFMSFFFSSKDANNVNKIINHLTGNQLSNPRIMKIHSLNFEILH